MSVGNYTEKSLGIFSNASHKPMDNDKFNEKWYLNCQQSKYLIKCKY